MNRRIWAIGCIVLASGVANAALGREWRDVTGQHAREAEYVDQRDGIVRMRALDGRDVSVRLERLSEPDRLYIAQLERQRVGGASATGDALPEQPPSETLAARRLRVMLTQVVPEASSDEASAVAMPRKYVYYGARSTSHLIDLGSGQCAGTIHYRLRHASDPCCTSSTWYLALLHKVNHDSNYIYFRPAFGDPYVDLWAFSRRPNCRGCEYSIWCHTRSGWQRFDCGHRVHPK